MAKKITKSELFQTRLTETEKAELRYIARALGFKRDDGMSPNLSAALRAAIKLQAEVIREQRRKKS